MLRFRPEFEDVGCSRGMAVAQYEEKQEQPDNYNKGSPMQYHVVL